MKDWFYNMFVWKRNITELFEDNATNREKYSKIKVHSGFYKMITTDNMHNDIISYMKDLIQKNPGWDIYFQDIQWVQLQARYYPIY